ncbi:response regulator [Paenibacillus radicis (ex Xue et al. 2023)]|uniref:Response regulator n=1 Tax=Paenibacillus radicis (ex Xue et al. 2023) TaxID=2972489 RepID=A0ABT1YDD6_9BACL|nr:response regulator [Paenibacillus radicis (ex Xue et al. 2023)]MCR8629970.1 response regulator [Paenibacillus radicis (ex Xue et al. 2023)]
MKRILVIDDEQHIRAGVIAKVEQLGDETMQICGEASNGAEGLKWLESNYADICITDIRMPIMDGLTMIPLLEQRYPWMQCIIMSSYDDFQYAQRAIQLGVTDYILKPIEREILSESLDHACHQIDQRRKDRAYHVMAKRIHESQALMSRWKDLIVTRQFTKYPLLVADTLNSMEEWSQGALYLLEALSYTWIQMVAAEVKLGQPTMSAVSDSELGFESLVLHHEDARFYFRLSAVMRLERGILDLFEMVKGGAVQENAKVVGSVKQYIDEHYAEKINLEELADLIPMSRSYLTVLFKQSTGITIWNYLVEVRMNQAKLMLLDQQLKIYQIANRVGYENSEHFSKLFKEYFGVTPKEYRRLVELNVE